MATTTPKRARASTTRNGNGHSPDPKLAPAGARDPAVRHAPASAHRPARQGARPRAASCSTRSSPTRWCCTALYKKHHWLVAGPTFYQLHLLFDKHAEEQNELIDLLAERVQSLGGIAVGDPRHAAELTTIPRPPDGAEEVAVMIDRTLQAHEIVIEKVRAAITATEEAEDWSTNDLLMGDVLRRHELQVWFLSEHVVDVPLVGA